LPSSSLQGLSSLILYCVVDTHGKFAVSIVVTRGKFVRGINKNSETGGIICCQCRDIGGKFSAGVVDTGGKFATGVVDTSGAP
jgi:hypothetical protein